MKAPKSSWVDVPPNSDFSIHNIPFGIFSYKQLSPRAGIAIGSSVLDLHQLYSQGYLQKFKLPSDVFNRPHLNNFFSYGRKVISGVRSELINLLRADSLTLEK